MSFFFFLWAAHESTSLLSFLWPPPKYTAQCTVSSALALFYWSSFSLFPFPVGGGPDPRARRAAVLPLGVDVGVRPAEGPASAPLPGAVPPQHAGLDAATLPASDYDDQGERTMESGILILDVARVATI